MPLKTKTTRRPPPKARPAKKKLSTKSGAKTTRRHINLPDHVASLPFSDAVLVGDTLYLSGRIGLDPLTGKVPEDMNTEIRLLLDGFEAVLAEAGMDMDDLVWVQVYAPDVSLWQGFNAAYVRRFSKELPARAFLGSGPLILNGRFEMMGIAVRR
ncbi:MAG TPA: RidA family protein [Candidatus Angelobacter sp.]|jgi:enamine deaminase RidA (YjgF/YER057c/UK114 family)|nr:RidA family protein [Candidatus Angelobacter sp.]